MAKLFPKAEEYLNDFENRPQEDDLISINKIIPKNENARMG